MLQYKMITHLNRDEVVRRLKNATVLKGEWVSFQDREKYLFRGKVDDHSFTLLINRLRIPPYHERNSLLPVVQGTIIDGSNGNCGPFFELENLAHWIWRIGIVIWIIMVALSSLCFLISDPLNGLLWILFEFLVWRLVVFVAGKYCKFVGKHVVEWFEELWDAREVV